MDVACIGTGRIVGNAALHFIPRNAVLNSHIHHAQFPARGQTGPEIAAGAGAFAEKHVIGGHAAIGLPRHDVGFGVHRGACGGLHGDLRRGVGDLGAVRVGSYIAVGTDITRFAVIQHCRPFVGTARNKRVAGEEGVHRNLVRRVQHLARRLLPQVHLVLHGAHVADHHAGRQIGARRRRGRSGRAAACGIVGGRGIQQPFIFFRRRHFLQEGVHHIAGAVIRRAARGADIGVDLIPARLMAQYLHHPVLRQVGNGKVGIVVGVGLGAEIHHTVRGVVVDHQITVLDLSRPARGQQRQRHRQQQRNGNDPVQRPFLLHR